MEFDHVPNPGVMSAEFLGSLNDRLKDKNICILGSKVIETMVDASKNLGDIMAGFGTWAIILKIVVYDCKNKYLQYLIISK